MSRVRLLRPDQEQRFRLIAERLADLNDEQLKELSDRWHERVMQPVRDARLMGVDEADALRDPLLRVEMEVGDLVIEEANHRLNVIYYATSDLNGGHRVFVGHGDDPKKYNAYCLPYEEVCWDGPDHDTIAEALEDGRNHHPGFEPTFDAGISDEDLP